MKVKILVVEDDPDMCCLLTEALSGKGYETDSASSYNDAVAVLNSSKFNIIITDLNIPGKNGIELCKHIRNVSPGSAVIVITAFGTVETAIEALKNGAYDFIRKPFEMEAIFHTVQRTVEYLDLSTKLNSFKQLSENAYEGIIGSSSEISKLIEKIKLFADTDTSILLMGESGTGKELFSKAIHNSSSRRDNPFIAVNCSALSENLLESELFGHVKGAFTDARKDRKGLFLKAADGTIFLDEIGDMPISLQVKLLRALEEKEIRPVGSDRTFPFNARVLTATNIDINKAVAEKKFREDLLYRINVIELKIPPLRNRQSDILILADCFIKLFCSKYSKNELRISEKALETMNSYHWPGNVRELKNAIEHAVIICKSTEIATADLPARILESNSLIYSDSLPLNIIERNHILRVYKKTGFDKDKTADLLQISKRTLYRRLSEFEQEGFISEA